VDPLVGEWKTSLLAGDGYLTFMEDGRVHIKNFLTDEWGVYVFSNGDLEIQKDSYFSHVVVHWRAQLSGDSLRVIEPEGATHVYTRIGDAPLPGEALAGDEDPTLLSMFRDAVVQFGSRGSQAQPETESTPPAQPEAETTAASPLGAPPVAAPPQEDGGFGDLMGEGGFIKPLDK
jgi:hypothetical protein